MNTIPRGGRRRTDQLTTDLAAAYRRIGVMHAVVIIKPALWAGDVAGALTLCDQLAEEATR